MSKTPNETFVYLSKCNIKLPCYFGNSKKKVFVNQSSAHSISVNCENVSSNQSACKYLHKCVRKYFHKCVREYHSSEKFQLWAFGSSLLQVKPCGHFSSLLGLLMNSVRLLKSACLTASRNGFLRCSDRCLKGSVTHWPALGDRMQDHRAVLQRISAISLCSEA